MIEISIKTGDHSVYSADGNKPATVENITNTVYDLLRFMGYTDEEVSKFIQRGE